MHYLQITNINNLLSFQDPLVMLFASTGMRIGAIPDIRLEHLHKIEKYNLYQITFILEQGKSIFVLQHLKQHKL